MNLRLFKDSRTPWEGEREKEGERETERERNGQKNENKELKITIQT